MPDFKDALKLDFGETKLPVEEGRIRDFSTALMDPSPWYRSPEKAKAAGLPDMPATITFPMCMGQYNDGSAHPLSRLLELGIAQRGFVLHGEQEFIYHRPIYAGETFTVKNRIVDAYQKEGGRGGVMTFFVAESEGTGADGKPAFASRMIVIERKAPKKTGP